MTDPVPAFQASRRAPYTAVSVKRAAALLIGIALLITHLLWRADATLAGLPVSGLSLSIVLFAAESFVLIALIAAALATVLPASVRPSGASLPESEWPSVDVFILVTGPKQAPKATYSLAAAAQLDYPADRVRLHLVGIDDAADGVPALTALAQRLKVSWLAASPEASAGLALTAALSRTAGHLVLVLNAGEAPTPDLLRRLAADFAVDPRLAFVDVPVFAIDGDPVLSDLDVSRRLPGDPGLFLKACMKAAGRIGLFGAGRRTLWQRAALTACGSFSRWGLSPDAITRMRAAEMGWRRAAATRPMIAALAPESVTDFLGQRLRHRAGMIEAAVARDPLTLRGASLRERLSWLPALLAAGLPVAWAIMLALPPLALLLQVPLTNGPSALEAGAMAAMGLIVALSLSGAVHAGLGGGLIATWCELLESLLSVPAAMALLRGQREAAAAKLAGDHASSLLVVLFAVALAGTTAGVAAWFMRPGEQAHIAPLLVVTILSASICALMLGALSEVRQRRLAPRVQRRFEAQLLLGGERYRGRLADISVHGARFIAEGIVDLPARALAGKLTLTSEANVADLPVQLSRQSEANGCSAFGLSFTGRTVGEFATVVRLAHRSSSRYADLCDRRSRPAGGLRMFVVLTLRGLRDSVMRLMPGPRQRLAPARKRSG